MTHAIKEENGTVDKFIGDAVMAFWGAPLHNSQHASHAIEAAMNIIPVIEDINWQFAARGWPRIDMGIGINSGKMSVGNMGSNFRMAYTVMGDAVNLGSRLEGLTKHYGVSIIVSESSKALAPEYVYRELDYVTVKGKLKPVSIYQPLGKIGEVGQSTLRQLEELNLALQLYRQHRWQDAEQCFHQLAEENPTDELYQLYLRRIAHYKDNPPGHEWSGVFVHTSK